MRVVDRLDEIIAESQQRGSRRGYFAALYRATTLRVRDNIEDGRFEDAERMSRMDAIFANYYFRAEADHRRGRPVPQAWQAAFSAEGEDGVLILQHLLLGMNAHINLDLGQAALDTAQAWNQDLKGLYKDYRHLNFILKHMIDNVQDALNEVSPWLGVLDWIGGEADELVASFSISAARELAWNTALDIERDPARREVLVAGLDRKAHDVARGVRVWGGWLAPLVRWRERDKGRGVEGVREVTAALLRRYPERPGR